MVQAQRSPRCRGWKDEAPGSEALHGKPWHFEDPHTCYRFIKVLGTGYYGVTYLCSNQHTGEFVAIKALDKLHPEYEREEAVEEILVLAAVCDHPNVVALHEVWEDASHIFIVMEACLGGELFDVVIERKFFTEADAASITAAVLSVIQHCHGKGIIHRDLKPENFLLLHPGELSANNLRAIDFGLAKFVRGGDGIFHSRVGSAYYVAPEVLKGAYSFEADAWSVGTIAYVLLSGFPPFWGSSDQIIFHRILNRPVDFDYQPWHQISAAAKDFVCRLLDKDPSTRMSVAQALLHPWITQEAATLPLSTEIIDRMQNFTHQNRIKCLLMTVAARHLSDEEIGGLRKVFHFIDADADGEISVHDLSVALRTAGLELGEADVAGLLAGLDLAHHGTVHVDEFIAAALDQRRVLTANTVNAIFAELDQDRDGLITVAQLQEALQACRVSCTADSLERLMRRQGALDTRGMVSSQSFASLLLHGDDAAEPLEQLEKWWADVQQFSAATRVRRLAMLVAALHMDPEEVRGPRHLEHLQAAMRHEGKEVGEQELRGLLEALDTCQQGSIALDQFLAACLEEEHLTDTRLRAAFDFFDRDGSGVVTEADMKQALTELCIDPSQAGELLAAACGGSPPTNSPRSLSFEAFCRMLLNQMPETATQAVDSPTCQSSLSLAGEQQPMQGASGSAGPPPAHLALPGQRGALLRDAAMARGGGPGSQPRASGGTAFGRPPRPLDGSRRLNLAALKLGSGDAEESPCLAPDSRFPGPEPPSPIDLMPYRQPPSPAGSLPQRHSPTAAFYQLGPDPPSPISLLPRMQPPSPVEAASGGGLGHHVFSPPFRPYAGLARSMSLGSPVISLSRHAPLSPLGSSGRGTPRASPPAGALCSPSGGAAGGGMTLQQILQQYSSSGYRSAGSRRNSLDTPRGGSGMRRDSLASDVSESWLGGN